MTTLTYTFEGGTDETTITTSDTGSGNAFDGVNLPGQGGSPAVSEVKYDTAYAASGSLGCRIRSTDAGSAFLLWDAAIGSAAISYVRVYLKRPTSLPATRQFVQIRDATPSTIFSARFTSAGKVALHDAGGVARYTSTKTFASDEEFRVELAVTHHATNGHMEARLFYGANLHGTTPDETMGSSTDNWNTGSAIDHLRVGQVTTAAAGTNETLFLDELAWSDVDWIGPVGVGGGGGTVPELTEPDTTGFTTLRDPNPAATWTPTLVAGTNYILAGPVGMTPWVRTARLNIGPGGGDVVVRDMTIDIGVAGAPMVAPRGGSAERDIWLIDCLLKNTAGLQSDGIQTQQAAGGNITTGSGGTNLYLVRTRIEGLQGSNSVAPSVHADGIQLSGGVKSLWFEDVTIQSGYVGAQLQREQAVTGSIRNVLTLTRSSTTATVEVSTGLDIGVGDWVELDGQVPTDWQSTYPVLSVLAGTRPNVTRFTLFLGDGGQATVTTPGTAQKSVFQSYIGDVTFNRFNFRRMANAPGDPSQTLTALRIPAGRPDAKGSNAEDRTPLLVDGMAGTLTLQDVYVEPNPAETLNDMLEPSDATAVYSLARGSLATAPTPDEYSWPNHPKIVGVIKHGTPPGGDYAPAAAAGVTAALAQTIPAFAQVLTANVTVATALTQTISPFTQALTADAGTPVAVVTGGPSIRGVALPARSWSIGEIPVEMSGVSANCTEGGFDQLRGVISETAWLVLEASGVRQGAVVKGWCSSGEQMWEGRLSTTPLVYQGQAQVAAQGEKYAAAKKDDRLFIQVRGVQGWTPGDSEPHLNADGSNIYAANKKIDLDISGSRMVFKVSKDITLLGGARHAAVFYAEGVDLARIAWTASYAPDDETANLRIQPFTADGPNGAITDIGAGRPTTAANNNVSREETFTPRDLVGLALDAVNTFTPTDPGKYRISNIRVNSDVTAGDDFSASEVATYIGRTLGWDTSGVQASTFNVLPFDRDGDWLAALLYVAELEDKYVRVVEGPRLEYGTWGDTTWEVAKAQGADVQLTALERYDRVEVWFEAASGVRRRAVVQDTSLGFGNTYKYNLEDRQSDATLAQAVAGVLFTRLSAQRYSGRIAAAQGRSNKGGQNLYLARYGDHVTVTDFAPGEALTQRVTEVSYDPAGVTFGIEVPVSPLQVVADLMSLRSKTRSKERVR